MVSSGYDCPPAPVLAEEGGRKLEELAECTHFTLKVSITNKRLELSTKLIK